MSSPSVNPWFPGRGCDSGLNLVNLWLTSLPNHPTRLTMSPCSTSPPSFFSFYYSNYCLICEEKSLKRLASTSTSPDRKPRVAVPDAVFQSGAELHEEYLVGSFLGKMPDYGPIQSVLNFMWGKGVKLEIHMQPQKRSFLVRIPNEFIRTKALEKRLWCVVHLSGVPFDLRTKEGLSLAADLVGKPIETDDYTKNLTDLNIAHVKVETDLTKPLPSSGELVRQNDCIYPAEQVIDKEATNEQGSTTQVTVLDPPKAEPTASPIFISQLTSSVPDPLDHDEEVSDLASPTDMTIDPPSLPLLVPSLTSSLSTPNPASSSSSPPSSPPSHNHTIQFTSSPTKTTFLFGIPATYAPTFGFYITTKQAAAFNVPSITLPPQFTCPSRPPLVFTANKKFPLLLPSSPTPKDPPPGGSLPPSL
ncbi:hypothetical protein Bca4012_027728 [Brassica carinata]